MQNNQRNRHVGIELKDNMYIAVIIEMNGKIRRHIGKSKATGRQVLYQKLIPQDIVALKKGGLAFTMEKEILSSVGCKVYVLDPSLLEFEPEKEIELSLKLAYMVRDFHPDQLPVVTAPDERDLWRKNLWGIYQREQQNRSMALIHLHSLLVSSGIITLKKQDLAKEEQRKKVIEQLIGLDYEEAKYLQECLYLYERRIGEIKELLDNEPIEEL